MRLHAITRSTVKVFGALALVVGACGIGFADSSLPEIHSADLIGIKTGSPFVYLVPATGTGTLRYSAKGLPAGLSIDRKTGIIRGATKTPSAGTNATLIVSDGTHRVSRKIKFVVNDSAVGLTPIMGWNSWYVWGCEVTEKNIRDAADLLVSTGLAAHGYNYVNIDDCWQGSARSANGELTANPRFGDMKALADYVHSKGLRIGIYTSPGPTTCAGNVGSLGHEAQDLATFARWEMDLLKYDWCSYKGDPIAPYKQMGDLLKSQSRAMFYNLCQYGKADVWTWAQSVGGNSWRTNDDLFDTWDAVTRNVSGEVGTEQFAGPGHFNDLDFLLVGTARWDNPWDDGVSIHPSRLTHPEQQSHIAFWSLLASPLIISSDLAELDVNTANLLMNDEVIAIDQDSLGRQASKVSDVGGTQVWQKNLADGSVAVGVFNMNPNTSAAYVDLNRLGLGSYRHYRDLFAHQGGEISGRLLSQVLPSHGVALYRLTK